MKKTNKFLVAVLSLALLVSMCLGATLISFAAAPSATTGVTQAVVRTDGTETQFIANESSPIAGQGAAPNIHNYGDTGEGIGAGTATIKLFDVNAYGVYDFDLNDVVSEAYLTVIGGQFSVFHKADGEADYSAFTALTPAMKYGVNTIKLTKADALKNANKKFKIKLTNNAGGQICLYMLTVNAAEHKITSDINYSDSTLNITPFIISATNTAGTYFGGSKDNGMLYLKPNAEVVYRFNIDSALMPKILLSVGLDEANATGNSPEWSYSQDGITFKKYLDSEKIDVSQNSTIFIKIKNGAGAKDLMFKSFSCVKAPDDVVATGENANKNVPVNETESYFAVGDESEKKYMFGVGADYFSSFNSTHDGMSKDGHEGGWAETQPNNTRHLLAGQYLAYDFDLKDDISSAKIKVHAATGLKFKVSTDDGVSYIEIMPTAVPGGRGMFILNIESNNALKEVDNKFRLVIEASGETFVFAVMVHEDKDVILSSGVSLKPWSNGALRQLDSTNKVHAYYGHAMYQSYFFKEADSFAIFKLKFDETVTNPLFYVNQCADVKIEFSGDGETYTSVLSAIIGGTGEVPYNMFSLKDYVGSNKTVWIKMSNAGNGGFVFDAGVSIGKTNQTSGAVNMNNLYDNIYSVTNNDAKIGSLLAVNAGNKENPNVKALKHTGETIYKIDLTDSAYAVSITSKGLGGEGEMLISKDAVTYTSFGALGIGDFTNTSYDILKNNPTKTIYVKIKGHIIPETSTGYITSGFTFTTEGIEQEGDKTKPYDDGDVKFDYDKELPKVDTLDKPSVTPTPKDTAKVSFNMVMCLSLSIIIGGVVLLAGAGILVYFLVSKKKKGAK